MFYKQDLPLLPGCSFNNKIGHERWHKSSHFDWVQGQVPCLTEPRRPMTAANYPFHTFSPNFPYSSLYPKRLECELPAWVIHDKQVLSFTAYYEDEFEDPKHGFKRRKVKINFFLEDGTMQVNELKMKNSGYSQGTLLGRRRVPFPKPMEKAFYEVIDLNVGKTVELYGRTYFIYDCDKFTRHWLNRSGIAVPEAIDVPDSEVERRKIMPSTTCQVKKAGKLGQFLQYDGHVLRFYGYWDDRKSEGGYIHNFIIQYYLSDDTMDVRDESGPILLARTRLPKTESQPELGRADTTTLLNVLMTGYQKARTVRDAKNPAPSNTEYYQDSDLLPGVTLNVYGRAVVLTHCDAFTQDYYKSKFGVEHFKREIAPKEETKDDMPRGELPPWNGFGTFEDSASNCLHLVPKPKYSALQKLTKSRYGFDSHILRFRARLLSDKREDEDRNFVVSYYLADDTASVYENAERNSGFDRRMFMKRKEVFKPTENLLVSRKPSVYTTQDLWIGNVLEMDKYKFELLEADQYTLRYMEKNSQEFTKSNIDHIIAKLRSKLQPTGYKEFVKNHLMKDGSNLAVSADLASALRDLMGDEITPHEIITLIRYCGAQQCCKNIDRNRLRDVCRSECRRLLYNGFDRFVENVSQKDFMKTGYLPRNVVYYLCRGAKVPVDASLLNLVLDEVEKNEKSEVKISDLLSYFDPKQNPCASIVPFGDVRELTGKEETELIPEIVDCVKLIEKLQLEELLLKTDE